MSNHHDTAMDELRRVCSGERSRNPIGKPDTDTGRGLGTTTVDAVPPPPPYRSRRPVPVLPPPDLEDLYTGRPYRPRQSVGRDGGSVGGGGHTDNAASPPVGWAFIVLLVLYATATVGAFVHFWGRP